MTQARWNGATRKRKKRQKIKGFRDVTTDDSTCVRHSPGLRSARGRVDGWGRRKAKTGEAASSKSGSTHRGGENFMPALKVVGRIRWRTEPEICC